MIGALWPKLSSGTIIGLAPFQYTVLIVCIPYTITGLTLLFPRLTLASYAAQEKVSKINTTLNSAVSALVRGFCAADHADLYTSEVAHHHLCCHHTYRASMQHFVLRLILHFSLCIIQFHSHQQLITDRPSIDSIGERCQ